jgi:hypothetical protein
VTGNQRYLSLAQGLRDSGPQIEGSQGGAVRRCQDGADAQGRSRALVGREVRACDWRHHAGPQTYDSKDHRGECTRRAENDFENWNVLAYAAEFADGENQP